MREQDHSAATPRIRVVIVDDSHEVRYLLATLLEADGRFHIVGEAEHAKAGLSIVAESGPDLVLVDLRLGRRDGLWVLRELRKRHPDTALALVTGSSVTQFQQAALAAGADSVHGKESMTTTMVDDLAASVAARSEAISA